MLEGIDLPTDFQILLGVTRHDGYKMRPCDVSAIPQRGEYKVMGEKIYSGYGYFVLTYQRTILPVKNLEQDNIEMPRYCLDLIVKITNMILNQTQNDIMLQEIENIAKSAKEAYLKTMNLDSEMIESMKDEVFEFLEAQEKCLSMEEIKNGTLLSELSDERVNRILAEMVEDKELILYNNKYNVK